MIKRIEIKKSIEIDEESKQLYEWVWNSHSWIEEQPGFFKCKWCDKLFTYLMVIDKHFELCKNNPLIKKIKKRE